MSSRIVEIQTPTCNSVLDVATHSGILLFPKFFNSIICTSSDEIVVTELLNSRILGCSTRILSAKELEYLLTPALD